MTDSPSTPLVGLPPAPVHQVGRAWVAGTAIVTGDVTLGVEASVWFGVVIRGDDAPIRIGDRTNVQDGTIIHADPDVEYVIGRDVTIGHGAICHGRRIDDRALVGMGAVLLEGSVIGTGAVVGAGAVVKAGTEVEPYALVVGVPAKVVKTFDRAERDENARWKAAGYVRTAKAHQRGVLRGQVSAPPA